MRSNNEGKFTVFYNRISIGVVSTIIKSDEYK